MMEPGNPQRTSRNAVQGSWTSLLRIIMIAGLGATLLATGCETTSWEIGEDLEKKTERFGWATPECVAREIGNPDYQNNDERLRLCQLEHRVEELERLLGKTPAAPQ